MSRPRQHIAVLGGGIQGICAALELASRGQLVTLVERDERLFNRASLRSEGKIHIGLIYAVDESCQTARRMAHDALEFGVVLDRLLGGRFRSIPISAPFLYLVPPDSMLQPAQLEEHYARVATMLLERSRADRRLRYLGRQPSFVWRRLTAAEARRHCVPDSFLAAYETEECSVDLRALGQLLREAVARTRGLNVCFNSTVKSVERSKAGGFTVTAASAAGESQLHVDQVVNATWERRMVVDATVGIQPPAPHVHRLKYRVLVQLPEDLRGRHSATYTLGPYGDVVVYPDGTGYVSWYPICRQGWSEEMAPPDDWNGPCRGDVSSTWTKAIAAQSLAELNRWFPGLDRSTVLTVDAGVIVAWGGSEIVDPRSGLHLRWRTGVYSEDGYHTIDTGKLTNAPHYAVAVANAVCGR